jgi:hypothetical protein
MSFLYPQFLYGLAALSIPVIIHLFNFRRTKKIYFSNSSFLQQVKDSKSARQKLKHLLIMLSRMMFLLFLILAFAQPFIPSKELEQQQGLVYIYLDNSLSMSNQVANNLSAFDQAIQNVERIVHSYPDDARFKLLTNDFSSPLRVFRSKNEVLDLLTEVKQTGVQRSFEDIWNRLHNQVSSASADWYFVSDFQKATFQELEAFSPDSSQQYYFIPQRFNSTANVFVDSVYLKNPFLISNDQNSMVLRVRNTGDSPVRDLVITLAIDNKQVANAGVNLPAHGEALTEINLNFPLEGNNPAKLTFEEFPVSFDNEFFFNLNLSQRVSVLEIKQEQITTPIAKVYGNKKLFDFSSYHVNNLDYTSLNQADLVVLNSVDALSASLMDRIAELIETGISLIIIPSENPDLVSLQRLAPFASAQASRDSLWISLEAPVLQNPFFENIFEDQKSELISMPQVKKVIEWSEQRGSNLLITKTGQPYLSSDFRAQVYLLASPLATDYTSLSQHAVFVPVMYKIAAQSKAFDRKLYYTTDEQIIKLTLDSISGNELFTMSNDEEEIIPNQRILGKELFLEVPSDVIRPGFYYLRSPTGSEEIISYNNNGLESRLEQYSADELKARLVGDHVAILDESDFNRYTEQVLQAQTGVPLWKYAVVLALIFLLTEVLLIRFLK